jgi:hypothetical protein
MRLQQQLLLHLNCQLPHQQRHQPLLAALLSL